jgi:HAD superfamily hydrolase (TIGR01509 family)
MTSPLTVSRRFRALIFDFDGLLVDSEVVWERVERDVLLEYGAAYDLAIMRKYMGTGLREWADAMVREYALETTPQAFAAHIMEVVVPELAHSAEPMPGALDTVSAAAAWGGPLAIASSSERVIVESVSARFGWNRAIPVRCTGDEVARAKPAPDLFLLAAERLGIAPADCLVLEDSVNGARAAHAAGMTCIAVPNPVYRPGEFDGIAAKLVPSLPELDLTEWLEM